MDARQLLCDGIEGLDDAIALNEAVKAKLEAAKSVFELAKTLLPPPDPDPPAPGRPGR